MSSEQNTNFDDTQVHACHCCKLGCKYGDDDCPVVSGKVKGLYACEDCICSFGNPDFDAEAWWNSLTPGQKFSIGILNSQRKE